MDEPTSAEQKIQEPEKSEVRDKKPRSPKLKLNVTREIIDAAIPRDSNHCMIAEALKEAFPRARGVSVDLATIRFSDRGKKLRYVYLTPRVVQAALVNFDQQRVPDPFSFVLRGGQVTFIRPSSEHGQHRPMSEAQQQAFEKMQASHKKPELANRGDKADHVPDRIGGKTPPLQKASDNLPFSRRRAFGLRALEL